MEPELLGLDFTPDPIKCAVANCQGKAEFIVKFEPHEHFKDRWYPVCLSHAQRSQSTACRVCSGKPFNRSAIETL